MKKYLIYVLLALVLSLFIVPFVAAQIPAYKSWLVNGSNLYTVSNNTGIGTANPAYRLDVAGGVRGSGILQGGNGPWERLSGDPSPCLSGQFVTGVGGTLTCATPAGGGGGVTGNGTDNYLPRWNGPGSLENSGIYQDDSGNVGIGTTTPDSLLNLVTASANPEMRIQSFSTTPIISVRTARGTVAAPLISLEGDEAVRFTGMGYDGAAYQNMAHIGFWVDGTPGVNDMPGRITFLTTPDGSTVLTERMRITNAGNVGIGITDPAQKLDVNGSIQTNNQFISAAPNGTSPLNILSTTKVDNLNADMLDGSDSYLFSQLGNSIESNEITDNTIVNADISPSAAIAGAKILSNFGGQNIVTMGNAGLGIQNPLGKLHVSGGNAIFDGSVGIGVTNPTARLDVAGPVKTNSQLISTATTGSPLIISSQTKVTNLNADLLDNLDSSTFSQLGNSIESNEITDNTIIDADISPSASIIGTKVLPSFGGQNIVTSGRVGIGTPNPILPLDVVGDVRWTGLLQGGFVPWARLVSFPSSCTSGQFVTGVGNFLACASPPAAIGGSGTANAIPKFTAPTVLGDSVIYENAGNTGIGTTNPVVKLDFGTSVANLGKILNFYSDSENNRMGIGMDSGSAGMRLYAPITASNHIAFGGLANAEGQAWTEWMRVDTYNGNVGIGTTDPASKLDVRGNMSVSGPILAEGILTIRHFGNPKILFEKTGVNARSWHLDMDNMNGDFQVRDYTALTIPFVIGSGAPTDSFRIGTSGNVGIGTANPTSKLDVRGNISISGSVVNEQGKLSFFVSVLSDDCGGSHPYLGCPAEYIQAGKWHTGGQCDGNREGEGYENGIVDSGWMTLCVAV